MRNRLMLCAVLSAASAAEVVHAQAPARSSNALTVYSGGFESVLVDPKDKGLLNALRLVDERIMELPAETKDRNMPAGAIRLAWDMLTGPMTLRAGIIPGADPKSGPPFSAQLDFFTPDAKAAQSLADRFSETFTSLAGQPLQAAPGAAGMKMLDAGGAPIILGPQTVDKQSVFSIGLGKVDPTLLAIERGDLPKDARPSMTFMIDPQQLQPFLDMMFANAGPNGAGLKQQLAMAGLYGPDAGVIQVAAGTNATNGFAVARRGKYRLALEKSGMLAAGGLTLADLKRIPSDATYAQVTKFNLHALGGMINGLVAQATEGMGQVPPDVMAEVEKQTGINPQRDIFDHLGETIGTYTSDATGGGGLMSAVMFAQVKNPDALKQTIARISAMANQLSQKHAQGYVRLSTRTISDQSMTVLMFPGLPIPLEISMAMSGDSLYAALSPQALLAAMRQGAGNGQGLMDNPAFKQAGGERIKDAMSFAFIDTPRTMRDGYGLISLAMAALSNAVRSPSDPARDPGIVMPSIGDLMHGASASLTIARIDKDDLVSVSQYDRSMLVNACGVAGMAGSSASGVGVAALMTGLLLPALAKAREQAQALKSSSQLRAIAMSMMVYAQEYKDSLPPNTKKLIDENYMTEEILRSPIGPAPDDQGDYWLNFNVKKFGDVTVPNKLILGYDRTMYAEGHKVAVVFFDGHAEVITRQDFDILIQQPPNAGIDFKLPE